MAKKLIFRIDKNGIHEELIEFKYYTGFAAIQKQKSIESLHAEIKKLYPGEILDISSKSPVELGKKLSAFNLMVKFDGKYISLENIFQSSKVFEYGGPYIDLLNVSPMEAKKDERIRNSGKIISFRLNGKDYPINPQTLFYDWIYCRALSHYPEYVSALINYSIFSDIEFNHEKSINCQARAIAIFVYLVKKGNIEDALKNIDSFSKYAYEDFYSYSTLKTLFDL